MPIVIGKNVNFCWQNLPPRSNLPSVKNPCSIGLPIHNSRHGLGFPVETFGMSEESNKYFVIVPKSLHHIFVTGNTRSI